jgi:hypothetical protein
MKSDFNKNLKIYNSLSGKKELFVPINKKKSACMYVDQLSTIMPI